VAFASLFVLSFAMRSAVSWGAPLEIPLTLVEPAGAARSAEPASASVPFPRGRLKAADGLWLAGPGGRAVPMQAEVLERWSDGTVRFLLIDFLATVPPRGRATYTLREGKPPAAPGGPRVRLETLADGGREVATGAISARVPASGDVLLADVVAGAGGVDAGVPLPQLALANGQPTRGEVTRLDVETAGPIRTEILLTGRHPHGMAFEARVAFFAGQPLVRVRYTLTNLGDPLEAKVRRLAFTVPGHFTRGTLGVDGGTRTFETLEHVHEVRHAAPTPALLDGEPAGRRADGWVRAIGDGGAVTLVAPLVWQEYPKALRVAAEAVEVGCLAGDDDPVLFGTGAAKTHEVWIALHPHGDAPPPAPLARALGAPLVALAPATWTAASRALPNAIAPDGPLARDFLARVLAAHEKYRQRVRTEQWDDGPAGPCSARTAEHPRVGLYGALDWGDWQFPGYRDTVRGCDGWGNLEYDLPQVSALAWTATGNEAFRETMAAAAVHYRDVDIIHHAPGHPDWVGLNHPHKPRHFSFEAEEKVDLGHTWSEGLVTYWRLTGDRRALAAARAMADALVPRVERAKNPRQCGWPMLVLVAVWDATGERRYLDAARRFAEAGMRLHRATPEAGDWKMGILGDGLAAVDAAAPDPSTRRWLVEYGNAYLAAPERWRDPRYALPLGYLARVTGDARYAVAAARVVSTLKVGGWGKPLAAMGRTGFRLLAGLPKNVAAPPPARPAPPARKAPPAGKRPLEPRVTPGRAASPRPSAPAPKPPSPLRRAPARPAAD
jgi:hypothetical protein